MSRVSTGAIELSETEMRPMLAQSWDKHKSKIVYPCIVQPKLDGIRCLAHREGNHISYYSRAGKPLKNLAHLDSFCLSYMLDGDWYDGELYNHKLGFNTICSYVKRLQEGTKQIDYWVYDVMGPGGYKTRTCGAPAIMEKMAYSEEEAAKLHEEYVKLGFEGSILRNLKGEYKHARSFDLQKRKDWFDEELPIIDVVEGKGKFAGCAIFLCAVHDSVFSCTSPGPVQDKRKFLREKETLIGKDVTVKFQEKTPAGIPRFPICIAVRDYE